MVCPKPSRPNFTRSSPDPHCQPVGQRDDCGRCRRPRRPPAPRLGQDGRPLRRAALRTRLPRDRARAPRVERRGGADSGSRIRTAVRRDQARRACASHRAPVHAPPSVLCTRVPASFAARSLVGFLLGRWSRRARGAYSMGRRGPRARRGRRRRWHRGFGTALAHPEPPARSPARSRSRPAESADEAPPVAGAPPGTLSVSSDALTSAGRERRGILATAIARTDEGARSRRR